MNPHASPGDARRPIRMAFTAAVGSHLETARCIERALRAGNESLACTVVDLVGFSSWDAARIPYTGQAERLAFDREACGIDSARIDSSSWRAVLRGATKLIDEIHPDLLVTMDDSWFDQHALILSARRLEVPVVLVQEGPLVDGIGSGKRQSRRVSFSRSAVVDSRLVRRLRGMPVSVRLPTYGRGSASAVMAASSWYKSRFIKSGVPSRRVVVTGIPRYDSILRIREQWLTRKRTAALDRPPRILLLSQPFVRYNELSAADNRRLAAIARGALEEVAQQEGAVVEVRLHPSDRTQDVDALVGERLKAKLVMPVKSLVETLASYDVVVGFSSSGLLEAMAIGLPIVVIETPPIAFRTRLFRDAGVPVATDVGAAVRLITSAVARSESPALPSMVVDEMGVLDGMASRRVARQCWRLLSGYRGISE